MGRNHNDQAMSERIEPDTDSKARAAVMRGEQRDSPQSVNIQVASASQFGGSNEGQQQNKDLADLGGEQRPQTAPVKSGDAAGDDWWPEEEKSEIIARMSQQMKKATDENNLVKQYKQKKTINKAVKAANQDSKSNMNEVRL